MSDALVDRVAETLRDWERRQGWATRIDASYQDEARAAIAAVFDYYAGADQPLRNVIEQAVGRFDMSDRGRADYIMDILRHRGVLSDEGAR